MPPGAKRQQPQRLALDQALSSLDFWLGASDEKPRTHGYAAGNGREFHQAR